MKVFLLRSARIKHNAGEIVEVSPVDAHYLISTHSAKLVAEAAEVTEQKPKGKKKK